MSAPGTSSTRVILGTATPGGGFPVYGDAVAALINELDNSLYVETRNTKGGYRERSAPRRGPARHCARAGGSGPRGDSTVLAGLARTSGF